LIEDICFNNFSKVISFLKCLMIELCAVNIASINDFLYDASDLHSSECETGVNLFRICSLFYVITALLEEYKYCNFNLL